MTPVTGIPIETENGRVKPSDFGVITLAARTGTPVTALVFDDLDEAEIRVLGEYGADRVVKLRLPDDSAIRLNPAVRAQAVCAAVKALGLNAVMGLSGGQGKDLIPRVAALLDAPLVMDCLDVDLANQTCKAARYSGKVLATLELTGDILVFGIRPNSVPARPVPARPASVAVRSMDLTLDPPDSLKLVSREADEEGKSRVSLAEADIIIAGGRGMKNKENFSLLFDCAEKLKAAVGASRVAVDEGWIPYAHQVGQTGEKVNPSVYIACGISGSIQHFAGMKTAKMIIAVNSDENAAMVTHSDYYAIGDLFEILPELIRQL